MKTREGWSAIFGLEVPAVPWNPPDYFTTVLRKYDFKQEKKKFSTFSPLNLTKRWVRKIVTFRLLTHSLSILDLYSKK